MARSAKASMTFVLKEPQLLKDETGRSIPENEDKRKIADFFETPIYMIVRVEGEKGRLKYSTGEKVNPFLWDKTNLTGDISKARGNAALKDNLHTLNHTLNRFREVFSIYNNHTKLNNYNFDLDEFKAKLDETFKGEKSIPKTDNKKFLVDFAKEFTQRVNRSKATQKAYYNTIGIIEEYQKARGGKKLRFEDITLSFYDDFLKFLQQGKGYALNTAGNKIKNLKVFMGNAYELGLHDNKATSNRKFKVLSEQTDQVYLTEEEVNSIWKCDLSHDPRLSNIRDIFIAGCRTGVRYGDLSKISKDSIVRFDGMEVLRIRTAKTGEIAAIPLHWQVDEILKKNNGRLPRIPSNQKFNEYIKEVCIAADIKDMVATSKTVSGFKTSKMQEKWRAISSHTARRTFATLGYLAGIPVPALMKITSHQTERAFFTYIRVTSEESAGNVAKTHAHYFQRPAEMKVG